MRLSASDRWITREDIEARADEVEFKCPTCGCPPDEHVQIQRSDDEGNDWESTECPIGPRPPLPAVC